MGGRSPNYLPPSLSLSLSLSFFLMQSCSLSLSLLQPHHVYTVSPSLSFSHALLVSLSLSLNCTLRTNLVVFHSVNLSVCSKLSLSLSLRLLLSSHDKIMIICVQLNDFISIHLSITRSLFISAHVLVPMFSISPSLCGWPYKVNFQLFVYIFHIFCHTKMALHESAYFHKK